MTTLAVPSSVSLDEEKENCVLVTHGANQMHFPFVGKTIKVVRKSLSGIYNIPSDATSLINSKVMEDNYVLRQADWLEFLKPAGVKG